MAKQQGVLKEREKKTNNKEEGGKKEFKKHEVGGFASIPQE